MSVSTFRCHTSITSTTTPPEHSRVPPPPTAKKKNSAASPPPVEYAKKGRVCCLSIIIRPNVFFLVYFGRERLSMMPPELPEALPLFPRKLLFRVSGLSPSNCRTCIKKHPSTWYGTTCGGEGGGGTLNTNKQSGKHTYLIQYICVY